MGVMRVLGAIPLLAACVAGRPPDWPAGREWSLPLIDPTDDGVLAVKGTIDGHGPYAFFLDTGAPFNALMKPVADELGVIAGSPSFFYDRTAHRAYTSELSQEQVHEFRVGDITTRHAAFVITAPFLDNYRGLRVGGTLGYDFLCRSYLNIEIDRDSGRVRLALPDVIPTPSNAWTSPVVIDDGSIYVPAQIDGHAIHLVIDTGSSQSMLIKRAARDLGLPREDNYAVTLKSFSGPWDVHGACRPRRLEVAGATIDGVHWVEMPDRAFGGERSWRYGGGFLGQDALARFHVILDFHRRRIALEPRKTTGRGEPTRLLLTARHRRI